jgi:hypothetical protein
MRFLREAKDNSIGNAERNIRETIVWRKHIGADRPLADLYAKLHPAVKQGGTMNVWGFFGRDKQGYPIRIERTGFAACPKDTISDADLEFAAMFIEELTTSHLLQHNKNEMVYIQDMKGMNMKHLKLKLLNYIRKWACTDKYYPRRAKAYLIINTSWIGRKVIGLVKMNFDCQHIKILPKATELSRYIDPKNLPAYLDGGTAVVDNDKECSRFLPKGDETNPDLQRSPPTFDVEKTDPQAVQAAHAILKSYIT